MTPLRDRPAGTGAATPGAAGTAIFDVADGRGGRVAVDRSDTRLAEGRSYVLALGRYRALVYATCRGGRMAGAAGPGAGTPVPFDPASDTVVGRVVYSIERR